ncbi:hypothetical protein [Paraburkholderia phenoliruptrix]|uniref:hypothetical protein n=1 Tax=Paraburkholderia phenoliruptrix TaxID=252970 RepID=UPI003D99C081
MDAIIRNKCELEFLTAFSRITELLGVRVSFEATVPSEGGFREIWKLALDKDHIGVTIPALTTILGIVVNLAIAYWNAAPRPNPELEKQQIEINRLTADHMRLENLRSNLEILKLQQELAKVQQSALPSPAAPGSAEAEPTEGAKPPPVQMDPKLNKRRSNFYKQLASYEPVTAVGFRWLPHAGAPTDEHIVPRDAFNSFVIHSDALPPEIVEAVIEIVSPVIIQGDMQWKGRWNGDTISFAMGDKTFKAEVVHRKVAFQFGDSIRCELEIERKMDEGGSPKVTGYRVLTVFEKIAGGVVQETPQGRRKRFDAKHSNAQGDMFEGML